MKEPSSKPQTSTSAPDSNRSGGELPGNSLGSMIGAVALGTIIAILGAFFCYALWIGYQKAEKTRDWAEVPCEITRSWIETKPPATAPSYQFRIEYVYTYEGKEYTGEKLKSLDKVTSIKSKALEQMADHPEGRNTVCFVNPDDHAIAILYHDTRAALYTIWFPGLFVVAGMGIAITGIRGWRRRKKIEAGEEDS